MKKIVKQKPQDGQATDILERVAKRIEDATIDINDMKSDLKMVSLRLSGVEHNTKMIKVDVEKMKDEMGEIKIYMVAVKKDIKDIKRNTDDLTETAAEILKKATTQEEVNELSQRVTALEQS